MENQLQIFSNPDFGDIRAVELDGKPYFVGKDAATALAYSNPHKALRDHVPAKYKRTERIVHPFGGEQETILINEAGLYKLVMRSKLPNAEKFSDWVYEEVLPSIRENGYYSVVENPAPAVTADITDFERGKELTKLAYSASGYMKKILIARAANLIAGETVFTLNEIGGTQELGDNDNYTFGTAPFDLERDVQPARYAFTLGKWKRKNKT